MTVEERVIRDQSRRGREQRSGIPAVFGKSAVQSQRVADRGRRLVTSDRTIRNRLEQRRDLIDELMTDLPEVVRSDVQRTVTIGQAVSLPLQQPQASRSRREDRCLSQEGQEFKSSSGRKQTS